jgi:hypothetical protein
MRIVWVARGPVEFSRAFSVRKLRRPLISSGCGVKKKLVFRPKVHSRRKGVAPEAVRLCFSICAQSQKMTCILHGNGRQLCRRKVPIGRQEIASSDPCINAGKFRRGECGCGFGEAPESYRVQVAAEELNRTNLDIDETNNNACRWRLLLQWFFTPTPRASPTSNSAGQINAQIHQRTLHVIARPAACHDN